RVVQTGLADSWRWRMAGGATGMDEHRTWWAGLVSAVAYAPAVRRPAPVAALDAAPLAGLVGALGGAAPVAPGGGAAGAALPAWLAVAVVVLLLAEWASRRLRGAP
ncbi:MAG TPA: hypothetical protein VNA89_11675, partial [Gemmatimonadaceae bacterium]|nr:hypothetical protein [Gemmatimonadaceae bacterium]